MATIGVAPSSGHRNDEWYGQDYGYPGVHAQLLFARKQNLAPTYPGVLARQR
jgi:hypothetical protein